MEKRISKAVKLKGKVLLIGCGTSVNQLSLEAKKAIQSCDAVLYDRLIDERVLRLVLASKIFVGKTPGESQKQGETNKLLFKLAKKGKTVGRLKAGDALLFSRGCEEKRFLEKNGVHVKVISGQSALNALTSAEIPLTCRGTSSSVSILTGVEEKGKKQKSFKGLDADTIVFFMPLLNLAGVVKALLKKKSAKTPCVFVENAGRKHQRKIFCILQNALLTAKEANVESPSLFVAGNAVSLGEPAIRDKKILSLRGNDSHLKTAGFFKRKGGFPVNIPVFSIKKRKISLRPKNSVFAFTSPNAVKSVFSQIELNGRFVGIGSGTAREIEKFGKKALIPKVQSVGGLEEFLHEKFDDKNVVVFCSPKTRLTGFRKVFAYNAVFSCKKEKLQKAAEKSDAVFFTSPEILKYALKRAGKKAFLKKEVWTIGATTAKQAKEKGLQVDYCMPFPDLEKSFEDFFK